jgi:hypothetical protein
MNFDKFPKLTPKQVEQVKKSSLWELALMMVAVLIPLFVFAAEIDKDEWQKAGVGVVLGIFTGAVLAIYKVWKTPAGERETEE